MTFAFLGFTAWAFVRLPKIYAFYTLVMVILPLSTASINSISRYYLVVFPAFILLAMWSARGNSTNRHFLLTFLLVSVQAVFMVFYVLGLPPIA